MPQKKVCSKCGEEKPLDEFHRRKTGKYGREHSCKACRKKRAAAYYEKNRERIVERTNEYRKKNLDKAREYSRRWKERNPDYIETNREKARQTTKAWNEANPERKKETDARRYRENPEQAAAYRLARRAHTTYKKDPERDAWLSIARADHCPYCGDAVAELDHIEPRNRLSPQFWNHWTNLIYTCRPCNRRKQARPVLIFLLDRIS